MSATSVLAFPLLFVAAPTAFTIEGIAAPETLGADVVHRLAVVGGDVDGDGVPDAATLVVRCAQGRHIKSAILQPRTAGKGDIGPVRWMAPEASLARVKTSWNLKENVKRTAFGAGRAGGGTEVSLSGADDLCAEASRVLKTKTKSNQSND